MVEQSHSRDMEHGRFEPGDHLRVRRPLGYWHHGIYVSEFTESFQIRGIVGVRAVVGSFPCSA